MGELYFIRHGQASYGAANYDKLSALGHQQSLWLGQHLAANTDGFDQIIHGNLRRHRETLVGLEKNLTGADTVEDARLNEMSYFVMERAYLAQNGEDIATTPPEMEAQFKRVMTAWQQDRIDDAPEGFNDFKTRVLAAVDEHITLGKRTLIVSSGGPSAVLLSRVLGLDINGLTEIVLRTYNASYSRYLLRGDKLVLSQFNGIGHLESRERQFAQTLL
ncbi:MAG: histidine phosphatase family protein [Alphaproteobacteria bacterium]|nr:histidine phosphatase family protein [Alphaproteobacteria bacterium]